MSSSPTTQGESENDNNVSSLIAEKGTTPGVSTDGVVDDDFFDESSIEALNWSEADEEELQQQRRQQKSKTLSPKKRNEKKGVKLSNKENLSIEGEIDEALMDQSSSTVQMLSSSLLQSINSNVGTDDESLSKKNQVIESWASDVQDAMDVKILDESVAKAKDKKKERNRKRKNEDDPMTVSSTTTMAEGNLDQLSNVPVLDDGPIWDKGPKRYRFQENRRINQKLTFGVLFALVLAIGLGLGNLVAYNECESEYKPNIKQQSHSDETVKGPSSYTELKPLPDKEANVPKRIPKPDIEVEREQYATQMQTLSKIVKTLDNLQMKIDKFENKTRKLGGVVVMMQNPAEEENMDKPTTKAPTPTVQTVDDADAEHPAKLRELLEDLLNDDYDDDDINNITNKKKEDDMLIDSLIHGIEETVDYVRKKEIGKKRREEMDKSAVFTPKTKVDRTMEATVKVLRRADDAFIQREREELRENKILGLAEERQPEDYSPEEKAEIKRKYFEFINDYPFRMEIDVEKERLKFVNEEQQQQESPEMEMMEEPRNLDFAGLENEINEINEFFKTYNYKDVEDVDQDDKYLDELDYDNFVTSSQNEEKDDDDDIPQLKSSKKSKRSKKDEGGSKPKKSKKKSKKSKSNNLKFKGSEDGRKEKKQKREKREKKWEKARGNNYKKGYDMSNNWFDDDSDEDDDHKRKRGSAQDNNQNDKWADDIVNWNLERTKVREEMRKGSGRGSKAKSQLHLQSSNGKKANNNNWQLERDQVREKVRGKNENNKNY